MRRDSITLHDLDRRGVDVRAWCFACARGETVDTIVWQRFAARGWPQDLATAARRFTCTACRSSADVALYPARRPPTPPNAPALLVEAYFHGMRAHRKPDAIAQAAATRLAAALRQRHDAKGVPTKK